jgi:hypothetical protein
MAWGNRDLDRPCPFQKAEGPIPADLWGNSERVADFNLNRDGIAQVILLHYNKGGYYLQVAGKGVDTNWYRVLVTGDDGESSRSPKSSSHAILTKESTMKKLIVLALVVSSVLAFVVSSSANTASSKEHRMIDPTVWGATVSNLTAPDSDVEIAPVVIVGQAKATPAVHEIQIWACTPMTANLVGGSNTTCTLY